MKLTPSRWTASKRPCGARNASSARGLSPAETWETTAARRRSSPGVASQRATSAEAESRRMIAEAHEDGERIRGGADEYAVSVLEGLETDVTKTLQSIQKGIAMLDDRRAALMSAPSEDGEVGDFKDGDWDDEAEDAAAPARS